MTDQPPAATPTLALSTKVEEDFVSPLTAVRGALEILRDYPDLGEADRRQFVESALKGCARLEAGVRHLAETVYAAGERTGPERPERLRAEEYRDYSRRLRFLNEIDVVEISLAAMEFTSSQMVNAFYDVVDTVIKGTRQKWYFIVDYQGCRIWPEAWVAFAHRAKILHATHALATVRHAASGHVRGGDPDFLDSRADAITRIKAIRASQSGA